MDEQDDDYKAKDKQQEQQQAAQQSGQHYTVLDEETRKETTRWGMPIAQAIFSVLGISVRKRKEKGLKAAVEAEMAARMAESRAAAVQDKKDGSNDSAASGNQGDGKKSKNKALDDAAVLAALGLADHILDALHVPHKHAKEVLDKKGDKSSKGEEKSATPSPAPDGTVRSLDDLESRGGPQNVIAEKSLSDAELTRRSVMHEVTEAKVMANQKGLVVDTSEIQKGWTKAEQVIEKAQKDQDHGRS